MHIRELRVTYGESLPVEGGRLNIKNPREVVVLMAPVLGKEVVEVCYTLLLTTRMSLIGYHQVSRGRVDTTPVHPREVFQAALMSNAASLVLVHNHPSGDPTPSADDFAITQRVKEAGELIGVELLDHVIVGDAGRYTSIRELGRL